MPNATYVPSRIGEGHFTDFQPPAAGATDNGKVWAWNSATSKFEPITPSSGGTPGGSSGQVQWNNGAGGFGGDSGFVYSGSGVATLTGRLVVPVIRPTSDSTTAFKFQNAAGTSDVWVVDTTNKRIGVNCTPTYDLEISSSNFELAKFSRTSTGNAALLFGNTVRQWYVGSSATNGYFSISTNTNLSSSSFVIIDNNGKTGIGNVTPNAVLDVFQSSSNFDKTVLLLTVRTSSTAPVMQIKDNAGTPVTLFTILKSGLTAFGSHTPTALVDIAASTTSTASLRIRSGVAPAAPNSGDMWFDGANLKFYDGSAIRTITWS